MRLFLAEKKSLGEAIAAGLGNGRPGSGRIDCGEDVVTWCAGHLLEEFMPEDYDEKWGIWRMEDLPIMPDVWKSKPKASAGKQLGIIRDLLKQAGSVVNCGDPDREGQVLVDEVLERFGYRGPVERLWLDDGLTPQAVRKALGKMRDNREYAPLADAARARSRADWLVGINASRAMSLKGQEAGRQGVLSVGRVQTPTLALVVTRDKTIEAFKPHPFFTLAASVTHGESRFQANWRPEENAPGLDEEGRLVERARAEALRQSVMGQDGVVTLATVEEKKTQPPLAYSLGELSKEASARYGMTAKRVLDAAQALYLAKLTSYPRTNCRYLPEEQQADAARILPALATLSGAFSAVADMAAKADPSLKSPAWNSAKQTAHHGIIPTGELPEGALNKDAEQVYGLICANYALQFHPPMRYEARTIEVEIAGTRWKAAGRRVLEPGWTAFSSGTDPDGETLPAVSQGDAVTCADVTIAEKKTTPPARFTDGTLLEAMENVHRHVEADAAAKDTLRQTKGIGTDATRAGILERLLKQGLLAMDGKKIVSTELGRQLVELVPPALKDPLTTAEWESRLEEVADGKLSLEDFLAGIRDMVPRHVELIRSLAITGMAGAYPCPECGKPLRRQKGKDGAGVYWACFNKEGHASGEAVFMDDKGGKPVPRASFDCPLCKKPMKHFRAQDGKMRWGCFDKASHTPGGRDVVMDDKGGKPVWHPCPQCGYPLRRCLKKDSKSDYYWVCRNDDLHQNSKRLYVDDKAGKPDFSSSKKGKGGAR